MQWFRINYIILDSCNNNMWDYKKTIFIIQFFIVSVVSAQSQRKYETNPNYYRTNNWIFGNQNSIRFIKTNQLDSPLTNGLEASSVFSTKEGRTIVYTDGENVWDSSNNLVVSGLMGNVSSSSGSVFCYNEDDSTLLLFNTNYSGSSNKELTYSKFKLTSNKIITLYKNHLLNSQMSEPLALIDSKVKGNKWLVSHGFDNNNFYVYNISNGVNSNCVQIFNVGEVNGGSAFSGQFDIRFSINGEFLIKSNFNVPNSANRAELFRFNNSSGQITKLFALTKLNFPVMGIAFSPDNSNLFVMERDSSLVIYKFYPNDSAKTNLSKKKILYKGQKFEIQNTIDNKIAFQIYDSSYLAIINSPSDFNNLNIKIRGLKLKNRSFSNGLPNFNQSYFYTPSIDFVYISDCINNSFLFEGRDTFTANQYNWQIKKIGKPVEATYTVKTISHSFADTGKYQVRYIASKGSRNDTLIKIISIYPKISKQFLGKDTFYDVGTPVNKLLKVPGGMQCQLWLNDSSGLTKYTADTTGMFICKVTSKSFCEVTDSIVITKCINNLVVPSIYRSNDSLFTYHQLADSFIWFRNNLQYKITKQPFIKLTDTGSYRVEAAKKEHCNRSSATQNVNKLGSHYPTLQEAGISIFPNPVNDILNITFQQQGDYQITIYSSLGQSLYSQHTASNGSINLSSLPAGVYLVQINNRTLKFNSVILKK
jgi:hypothetical protein